MSKNQFVSEYGELSNEILLNIAEILTIRLPEGTERIIASKWVKKFNVCDPKSYQQYLTLFVSCLTKELLVEPFDKPPKDTSSQWDGFDKEYTLQNINNAVIRRIYMNSFTPPYQLDMSSDLKEYVAFQEIPFFGAHFYYAFSPRDRIDKWAKFNKMNVPKKHVEILRKDDPVESPIKGRLFPRPKFEPTEQAGPRPKLEKSLKPKKPQWTDLIAQEEEEAEPEPEKKPMIVIPTDVPAKNIPVGLQRRMAKAEQERQERIAKKAQETKDRQSKSTQPKKLATSRRTASAKPLVSQKKQLKSSKAISKKIPLDDIDANLMRPEPSDTQMRPKSPEFKGPHADLQRRLFHLRQSNAPPSELIKTTQDISKAAADINKEAERLQRDGIANLKKVETLHDRGLSVGNRILNMLREHQANGIYEVAENAAGAIENVRLTMEQLNEMLEEGAPSHDETLKKLNEIKERMQKSALEAQNASIQLNGIKMGHELMDMMNNMVNVNENSAVQLEGIRVETQQEGILIEGLEKNSQDAAEALEEQRDRLSEALDNLEPNLLPVLGQTVKTIDEILSNSIEQNIQLCGNVEVTKNAQEAIEIEATRNEQLNDMNEQALQILQDVEIAMAKVMDIDPSDDLIDIDKQDLGFADVVDENEVEMQRQLKFRERQERFDEARQKLVAVTDTENLEDISSSLIDDIERSIAEVDQVLIPGLNKLENRTDIQRNREIINEAVQLLEINNEALRNSLVDMINLREAVADERNEPIEHDLMIFEEDDLIQFD